MAFSTNRILHLSLTLGLALLTQVAGAQTFYPPVVPDAAADPGQGPSSQGIGHTGTDIIIDSHGNRLQVMTWDNTGGTAKLSWAVNSPVTPIGSNHLDLPTPAGNTSDPDVVMAYQDGEVYAAVVYLVDTGGSNRTHWAVYHWDATSQTFTLTGSPQALGSTARSHSSPNIDANSKGEVGIVWEEFVVETATITVTNATYPAGYTYTQPALALADSYVLGARIDGQLPGCNDPRGELVTTVPGAGDPPVLFNQALNPDVAVGITGLISVAFINSYAQPTALPVQPALRLVVRQLSYSDCRLNALVDNFSWQEGVSLGIPRIAASAQNEADVELAVDWLDPHCEEGIGRRTYAEIHNFGKSFGSWRDTYTTVSLPYQPGEDSPETIEPVVTYLNQDADNAYIIDWTAYDYNRGDNSHQRDVWSRTLQAGVPLTPDFSRVNELFEGNQQTPSVAARYSDDPRYNYHLFYSEADGTAYYKQTVSLPGSGPLMRPGQDAAASSPLAIGPAVQAYPNPAAGAVDFQLQLAEGERVKELAVYDLLGRVVDHIPMSSGQGAASHLIWQPKAELPAGIYQVRLSTTHRTLRTSINRVR